ncbi:MAG: hypothetical protein ACFCBU_10160 [Cyanophyceae cyanobacterium]
MKHSNSNANPCVTSQQLFEGIQGTQKIEGDVAHAPGHQNIESFYPYSSSPPQSFSKTYQNLNSSIDQGFGVCQSIESEPEIWASLIAEHCNRRDKHRLRECLDGLRCDETLTQGDRREIWQGLSAEQRVMCKAIAGGEANG